MLAYDQGALLQDAFPTLGAPEREFIKTGVTAEEWNEHVVRPRPGRRRRRVVPRNVPPE